MPIHLKTNELLLAVRQGNDSLVRSLVATHGKSLLNSQDHFGATALHVAAMYGQQDIIQFLVKQPGINLNLQAYRESEVENTYSPLDLAIKYHQPVEMVHFLLQSGASTKHPTMLLVMLFEEAFVADDVDCLGKINYSIFEKSIHLLDLLVKKIPEMVYIEGVPLASILHQMNCFVDDPKAKVLMQKMIDNIVDQDTNHYAEMFVAAKNFTHAFPSSYHYTTINTLSKKMLDAEGHFTAFTVQSFYESMADYRHILDHVADVQKTETGLFSAKFANYIDFKKYIFSEVESSFYIAKKSIENGGLYDVSKMLYQLYDQGQTILLPTGWDGHAVDIILDKNLGLYIVANAGERYQTLASGVRAYTNNSPISTEDIFKILNNEEQFNLEFDDYYKLSLSKNIDFSQVFPNQEYGNCALHSLLLAHWSLTYINVYKNINNPTMSKKITDMWHQDMVEHHKTVALKNYLEMPYFKEDKPLYDALIKYESKIDHVEKKIQANLMLDYLTSAEHVNGFKSFYKKNHAAFSPELKKYIQDNGYGVSIKINDVLSHMPVNVNPDVVDVPVAPMNLLNPSTDMLFNHHDMSIYTDLI